jgi:hypothetical protein
MADQLRRWRSARPETLAAEDGGWVTLKVQFEDEEQARFIALGTRAHVIGPPALRDRVQADRVAGSVAS